MNEHQQSNGSLDWQVFLSAEEVVRWTVNRDKPNKLQLHGSESCPGIYRFIFPAAIGEVCSHTPCYVGETGDLGDRMPDYFCAIKDKERRDKNDNLILDSEWKVRGAIQNAIRDSMGNCFVQLLEITNSISICKVTLNETDLDQVYARRLLENWGILQSIGEGLYPLNCGINQGMKDFRSMAKSASEKAQHHGMDKELGWQEEPQRGTAEAVPFQSNGAKL